MWAWAGSGATARNGPRPNSRPPTRCPRNPFRFRPAHPRSTWDPSWRRQAARRRRAWRAPWPWSAASSSVAPPAFTFSCCPGPCGCGTRCGPGASRRWRREDWDGLGGGRSEWLGAGAAVAWPQVVASRTPPHFGGKCDSLTVQTPPRQYRCIKHPDNTTQGRHAPPKTTGPPPRPRDLGPPSPPAHPSIHRSSLGCTRT